MSNFNLFLLLSIIMFINYSWVISKYLNILISSNTIFCTANRIKALEKKKISFQIKIIREGTGQKYPVLPTINAISTSQILSVIICSLWLIGKFEPCYVVMETTKYKSITEQTRNDGFHINWPTGNDKLIVDFYRRLPVITCWIWFEYSTFLKTTL